MRGDEAGERSAQQYAAQQPRHDRADGRAAPVRGSEVSSQGHDLLRDGRGDTDQKRCGHDQTCGGRDCGGDQRGGKDGELDHDQTLALDQVAERHQEEQSRGIAELCRSGDQGGQLAGQVLLDHAEHRLIVIDVGDRDAGGCGHRERHAARQDIARRTRFRAVLRGRCHGQFRCTALRWVGAPCWQVNGSVGWQRAAMRARVRWAVRP